MQDEKDIGGNKTESELCPVCMEKGVNMTLGCGHRFCAMCVMQFTKPTQMQYDYGNP